METILALATILSTVLLGAMSPGASFLTVARISVAGQRRDGLAAAVGMGIGGTTLAILAMLGMKAILVGIPRLYVVLRLVGGVYLVYVGVRIWQGAKEPISGGHESGMKRDTVSRSFIAALSVQLSNPKTILFYASIFAALLPKEIPLPIMIVLPTLVFIVETAWYCIVALVLSTPGPRSAYLRSKVWIDRTAGGLMGYLGTRLIVSVAGY